ncbi:sigma 54 modulation/S30EA ribosomal C-terminal domain-containing protein [Prauserella muralis]|uniref:Sigma 54 modulation/S30EA ribosomal protein C-terminal domain-containing protein n=1 Tax=Prauserella muralis TaxID=588067 RepID=A0A2V4AP86_9PSEU|nr:sigma 54 modulation/S30EA ribosomal C-terminal domain-containing protein [Prauserella muralis]PXY22268.1 hypothetical protein BAY60_20535 [Prauserella muralis]TWE27909.1 sigma 54 modulation/S30EA-like ribosomal protein [Prauserella muralis]
MRRQALACGLVVQTRGEVLDSAREYVRKQLAGFARRLPGRLGSARVKLTAFTRPSAPVPALAQANLEVDGRFVRAQVAAAFFTEAAGQLRARLRDQVAQLSGPRRARPWTGVAPAGPLPLARPAGQREIVRRKEYRLAECDPDQAALTMDLMDYDCYLFTDAGTGEDSVVYRVGPTGYRLARLSSPAPPAGEQSVPLTVNVHPVPELTPAEAARRLDETDLPFTFFADTGSGRGSVLYRRYDGHYAQIAPH